MTRTALLLALGLTAAGCSAAPPPRSQSAGPAQDKPGCQATADAKGIAAGFFAFFQDRPECF